MIRRRCLGEWPGLRCWGARLAAAWMGTCAPWRQPSRRPFKGAWHVTTLHLPPLASRRANTRRTCCATPGWVGGAGNHRLPCTLVGPRLTGRCLAAGGGAGQLPRPGGGVRRHRAKSPRGPLRRSPRPGSPLGPGTGTRSRPSIGRPGGGWYEWPTWFVLRAGWWLQSASSVLSCPAQRSWARPDQEL